MFKIIGKPLRKVDAVSKCVGQTVFADDVVLPERVDQQRSAGRLHGDLDSAVDHHVGRIGRDAFSENDLSRHERQAVAGKAQKHLL